jgi:hypothetical protein
VTVSAASRSSDLSARAAWVRSIAHATALPLETSYRIVALDTVGLRVGVFVERAKEGGRLVSRPFFFLRSS